MASELLDCFYSRLGKLGIVEDELSKVGLFDAFEAALSRLPQQEHALMEVMLPDMGFYVRTAVLPADSVLISNRHGTWHPFIIRKGRGLVIEEIDGVQTEVYEYIAGGYGEHEHFTKLTKPGTRRIILVVEETEWTTFHATDKESPYEIMKSIIVPNTNPLLSDDSKKLYTA